MIARMTARALREHLAEVHHDDEPLLCVIVSGNDIKEAMTERYCHPDDPRPTVPAIITAMDATVSSMLRTNDDLRIEERIAEALPDEPDGDFDEEAGWDGHGDMEVPE